MIAQMGRRIITLRMRSTQKFPIVVPDLREKPYMNAMRTAMPTAADMKFWTARPVI